MFTSAIVKKALSNPLVILCVFLCAGLGMSMVNGLSLENKLLTCEASIKDNAIAKLNIVNEALAEAKEDDKKVANATAAAQEAVKDAIVDIKDKGTEIEREVTDELLLLAQYESMLNDSVYEANTQAIEDKINQELASQYDDLYELTSVGA